MKVIIQKDCYDRIRELFDASGLEFLSIPVSDPAAMVRAQLLSGAECFIIGAEKYPEEFYSSIAPDSLIIRYGVGYDQVPVALCRERGIKVAYTPGTLDRSVAEHTVALMLAWTRGIAKQDHAMRAEEWIHTSGRELGGKRVAVLGFGRIGRSVAGILKNGFGMRVTAFDIFPELDEQFRPLADRYNSDYFDAVADADYISLHMNVSAGTRNFIHAERLGAMKPGACLVNTARGALVDENDLYDALAGGTLGGAALDVYAEEPYRPSTPERDLRKLPNVVLTSHCGSNTFESNRRMAEACIANVQAWYGRDPGKLVLIPEMR